MKWFSKNLATLLLALVLALAAWIAAVNAADPIAQRVTRPVKIEVQGIADNLLIVNTIPEETRITIKAPQSIWEKISSNPSLIKAWIDLAGLSPGEHTIPVKVHIDIEPIRYLLTNPEEVTIVLEPLETRKLPLEVLITGSLPLGYKKGVTRVEPEEASISGPQSEVSKVAKLRANLNISGAITDIDKLIPIELVGEDGAIILDVNIQPDSVRVIQPISLLGGFKNVAVKVVTEGQVANGYRLTNISVSPPNVTLFSNNPELVDELPGFVETLPVNLTGISDDIEILAGLNLAEEITPVRDRDVLVQVSVAAIEGSLTVAAPVEIIGLLPELEAIISPETIDVIVAGPLNTLENLTSENLRVILDLTDLPAGVYQRQPAVEVIPETVRVQTTLPEMVEVTIQVAPTPTITPTLIATTTPRKLLLTPSPTR